MKSIPLGLSALSERTTYYSDNSNGCAVVFTSQTLSTCAANRRIVSLFGRLFTYPLLLLLFASVLYEFESNTSLNPKQN